MTFRYCFKGYDVPTRPGGFWTKSGTFGNAFVVKNVNDDCTTFGNNGSEAYLDTKDTNNPKMVGRDGLDGVYHTHYYPDGYIFGIGEGVRLQFCIIGQQDNSTKSDHIGIGEFNQMFGFFNYPNNSLCPILESPHGILHATKEKIFLDLENSAPQTRGGGPFVVGANKDAEVGFCVYDPSYGENN